MEIQLFTPELTFSTFLAIFTKNHPCPPIPARPGPGSANLEQLFVEQIAARRPRTRIHQKSFRAPTCTRVRTLGRLLNSKVFLGPVHVCRSVHWRGIGERAPECHPSVHPVGNEYSCSFRIHFARSQLPLREINSERAGIVISHRGEPRGDILVPFPPFPASAPTAYGYGI